MEPSDLQKSLKFIGFYTVFELLAVFKLGTIFDAILMPTWLHFGRILDVLGGSGRLLGRFGAILGPSWGVLAASWRVLDLKSRLGTKY